jgi:predicted permease
MSSIMTQMAVLFLILALGYIANKTKILNVAGNKLLSRLVVNVTMPCLMLSSVMDGTVNATGSQALVFSLLTVAALALAFLIAWPVPVLIGVPREERNLIRFLMIFGNIGFMGYPVVGAIFGNSGLFYVTLINIPFNIITFTLGILLISGKNSKLSVGMLLSPSLIASLASVLLFAVHVTVPAFIADTASIVGHMTTPAAMLIIGSSLAEIPVREVFSEVRLYPVALVKLIVIPVALWFILHFFIADAQMLGILIVETGMPTATIATMLSLQYGGNDRLASKGIFITTLLSVVTIPLLVLLLLR